MKITFTGAAREVTGSRHLLEINGKKVLLDCGLYQGRRSEEYSRNLHFPFNAKDIEAVVLSHAHIDHSGNTPILVKHGFDGKIFCTPATRDLCYYMLRDGGFIQEREVEYVNKRRAKKGLPPIEPLYTLADGERAFQQMETVQYERSFHVVSGMHGKFYDAGHILGSAMVYITLQDEKEKRTCTLCFTGDLGRRNLPILKDPEDIPHADYLICESTYGNRLHESMADATNKLADVVNKTVKRGGKVLVPAFALERTQEIVFELQILHDQKKIPEIPIFIDSPLSMNVTGVFREHPECFDEEAKAFFEKQKKLFQFSQVKYTRSVEESKALNALKTPCIIIASSGMCEHGRILHHLKNNIEDEKNTILLVGFMAKDTLGRKILEKRKVVNIFGDPYNVRAEVVVINAYSAHADRSDLLDFIAKREGLKKVFLVHGEEDQMAALKNALAENGIQNVEMPKLGETFEL